VIALNNEVTVVILSRQGQELARQQVNLGRIGLVLSYTAYLLRGAMVATALSRALAKFFGRFVDIFITHVAHQRKN
jgi:hypothetical protein